MYGQTYTEHYTIKSQRNLDDASKKMRMSENVAITAITTEPQAQKQKQQQQL